MASSRSTPLSIELPGKNMKTSFTVMAVGTAFFGVLCAGTAHAGHAELVSCNVNNVQVTTIKAYDSISASATLGTVYSGAGISAFDCAGAFSGNATPYPSSINMGYLNDGLLNGAPQKAGHSGSVLFPGGAFVQAGDLSNLQGKGNIDPGWILLGTVEFDDGSPEQFKVATINGNSSIILDSFFKVTSTGKGTGTWQLTPDALVAQRALPVLGNNYFDQFALVFKQANSFAAYDFTAKQFGITELTANDPIYNWFGTYDVSKTLLPSGMSHIDIYARDPGSNGELPEPSSLALLGLGLIGIARMRRNKKKKN